MIFVQLTNPTTLETDEATFDIEITDGIRTSKLVDNTDAFQGFC